MAERCEHYRPGIKTALWEGCELRGGCTAARAALREECLYYWSARAERAEAKVKEYESAQSAASRGSLLFHLEGDLEAARRELPDHKLLVQAEVARLRVLLEESGEYTGQRLILESVIENLSAPAQEGEE